MKIYESLATCVANDWIEENLLNYLRSNKQ
jgi:hypothetical protein